jgi:2'-hydroxyisoflavone reductase
MDILVLGGTVFLSRAMAELSVARGHNVTTFNRGLSGLPVQSAQTLIGDRDNAADLEQLRGTSFDLVFDTAYLPQQAKATAELLEPSVGHYAFVSTINVYPGWPQTPDYHAGGIHDGNPDAVGDEVPEGLTDAGPYGWRKVGAERAVLRAFGEHRTSILRAGLIVGANDKVGRLPWWLNRIAQGGQILAPGQPDDEIRLIDARDIAEFALKLPAGSFETTGPAHQITRRQLFDEAAEITGAKPEFSWIPDEFLTSHGVEEWTEVPIWASKAGSPSLFAHDTTAAEAAGLACRSVKDTLVDTWEWMRSISGGWQPSERTPGLAADRERELLDAWAAR